MVKNCPAGLEPLQGLTIGETLLRKYHKTPNFYSCFFNINSPEIVNKSELMSFSLLNIYNIFERNYILAKKG